MAFGNAFLFPINKIPLDGKTNNIASVPYNIWLKNDISIGNVVGFGSSKSKVVPMEPPWKFQGFFTRTIPEVNFKFKSL